MDKSDNLRLIQYDELSSPDYVDQLGKDLVKLANAPGPSRCVAKIGYNDPRLLPGESFPITTVVQRILERLAHDKRVDLVLRESNGNVLIAGGLGKNPADEEIYHLPVTLGAHLDEITYMVKNQLDKQTGLRILVPLCNAVELKDENTKVRVLGFRDRRFKEIGTGTISFRLEAAEGRPDKKWSEKSRIYLLETQKEVRIGDLVIQDYCYEDPNTTYSLESQIHVKALDDRAGCICQIYAVAELAARGIPAKAVLVGDEEGFNADVSWARLVRPAFRKYVRPDRLVIICDGFDGKKMLEEFAPKRDKYLSEALVPSYVGSGKGAGDPGLFAIFRDHIVDLAMRSGFEATVTTNYASRSFDPKIMDEFPLISFIDWSNGLVGGPDAICHRDESILLKQVINIIGTTVLATWYFTSEVYGVRF